jgi:hypothetical protein
MEIEKLNPSLCPEYSYIPGSFKIYDTVSIIKLLSFELDDDYTLCNGKFDEKEMAACFELCIEQQFQYFITARNISGSIKTRKHSAYNTNFAEMYV